MAINGIIIIITKVGSRPINAGACFTNSGFNLHEAFKSASLVFIIPTFVIQDFHFLTQNFNLQTQGPTNRTSTFISQDPYFYKSGTEKLRGISLLGIHF